MRYRKLDANNDYTFGNGQLDFYTNAPAGVGQKVLTYFLLWLGEWYLDTSLGTPYIQGVLGKHTQAIADGTVQTRAQQVEEVTDISSFASQYDSVAKTYNAQIKVDTIYGPTSVDLVNQQLY